MSDTTPRDKLVDQSLNVLCNAANFPRRAQPALLGSDMRPLAEALADELIERGWRPPARVVTTWEEVQSLKEGTILTIERRGHMWVYERQEDYARCLSGGGWRNDDWLPATVIYEPEEGE